MNFVLFNKNNFNLKPKILSSLIISFSLPFFISTQISKTQVSEKELLVARMRSITDIDIDSER